MVIEFEIEILIRIIHFIIYKTMKKIYFLVSMAVLTLFTACEGFNERNFPGYDEAAKPTNIMTFDYTLTSSDYASIGSIIKKPVEDKITTQNNLVKSKEAELKNAKNAQDSIRIKAELVSLKIIVNDSIAKLKNDSLYILANAITTNKFFADSTQFIKCIPLLLNSKYVYGDEKSSAQITFNFVIPYDTTKIAATNKYTLVTADYDAMGVSTGQPGQYDNFSASINPGFYLPIWLKLKYPYAKSGDVQLIRYLYKATAISLDKGVFVFDGTNWIKYNTTNSVKAKFILKSEKWQFIDSDILIGLTDGIGDFTAVNVIGDQVWAWNSYKYMLMTGYVSGAYFDNEDWLISPAMNLTERTTPWLTFTHVGRYFGDTGTSNEKMRKAITIWASTKSDGTSITPADWTQLTIPEAGYPSGANWTFIPSTPISLAAYAGKNNVRIAFKYLSSGADGAAGSWEVKNFYVYEE